MSLRRFAGGLAAAGAIGWAGWRRAALSGGGAVAATLVGGAVLGGGGPTWAPPLIAFFTGSSALSRLGASRKAAMQAVAVKGSRRDAGQVLANGGVAAALALVAAARQHQATMLPAFVGSLAAVNGDTWSTEIGGLSRRAPRSIVTGRSIPAGTSGGVTALGLTAALAGGVVIGAVAGLAVRGDGPPLPRLGRMAALGGLAGLGGSLADSLLGATVQQQFYCPRCRCETERRVHTCGQATVHMRGVPLIDNDVVNGLTALVGAAIGAAVGRR